MDTFLELSFIGIVILVTIPETILFAYTYTLLKDIEAK